jgi:hypothetical protein
MAIEIFVAHQVMDGFLEHDVRGYLEKDALLHRNALRDYTPIALAALASIGLEVE